MPVSVVLDSDRAPSAYDYPLLVEQLLHTSLVTSSRQEIVYGDQIRHDYRTFRDCIGRLNSGLPTPNTNRYDLVPPIATVVTPGRHHQTRYSSTRGLCCGASEPRGLRLP